MTVVRFRDANLRLRMEAYAQVLRLRLDPEKPKKFEEGFARLANSFSDRGFRFYERNPRDPEQLDPTTASVAIPAEFRTAVASLAEAESPSYEFTRAIRRVSKSLEKWSLPPAMQTSWWSRFAVDNYRLLGVAFGEPRGDLGKLRDDAGLFLTHREIFATGDGKLWATFSNAPLEIKLMPWKLIRFSDEVRFQLNNTIPVAFGMLLLACGLLLQFRLIDYEKPKRWLEIRTLKEKAKERWVAVWRRSGKVASADLSLFSHPWLGGAIALAVLTLVLIELVANTPRQRIEWIINLPIMMITGAVLPIIWLTLFDLGSRVLNPELSRYSANFREKLLRPLLLGLLVMTLAACWALLYSIFDLPGSLQQSTRSAIQVAACVFTLYLLLRVLRTLNRQLRKMETARSLESELPDPEHQDIAEADIIAEFFPGLDDRALRALLLASPSDSHRAGVIFPLTRVAVVQFSAVMRSYSCPVSPRLIILVAALLAPWTLAAEDNCADILRAGFDELNLTSSTTRDAYMEQILSSSIDDLEKKATEKSGGGRVAFSLLKIISANAGGSGKTKSDELRTLKRKFDSNRKEFFQSNDFLEIAQKTVNQSVVEAWLTCIKTKSQKVNQYVASDIAGDPLSEAILSLSYAVRPPEGKDAIAVTDVSVTNITLKEKSPGQTTLKPGLELKLNDSVFQAFTRNDRTKPALLLISCGNYGSVRYEFPVAPMQVPTAPTPVRRDENISESVSIVGKCIHLGGGDDDIDTDPNDVVTVQFSSRLAFDEAKVTVAISYSCEEYRGNHTKLGIKDNVQTIFQAPSGMKIIGIDAKGGMSFVSNPATKGRNHGFLKFPGLDGSYWKNLTYRVDSTERDDRPAVGTTGVVEVTVKLQSK